MSRHTKRPKRSRNLSTQHAHPVTDVVECTRVIENAQNAHTHTNIRVVRFEATSALRFADIHQKQHIAIVLECARTCCLPAPHLGY